MTERLGTALGGGLGAGGERRPEDSYASRQPLLTQPQQSAHRSLELRSVGRCDRAGGWGFVLNGQSESANFVPPPPGVCPKFKNEPEKLFRISKSTKNEPKTNLNEPRTNPDFILEGGCKSFKISTDSLVLQQAQMRASEPQEIALTTNP